MKILITGFGSFPGVDQNPTEILLQNWRNPEHTQLEILPVEYAFCSQWVEDLDEEIDFIIHLGVAVSRKVNCLERKAFNRCSTNPDISGKVHSPTQSKKNMYECQLDLEHLITSLGCEYQLEISDDAGDYLCNFIYYKTLSSGRNTLFVHIPPFESIELVRQLKFLNALVEEISYLLHSQSH